MSLFFNNGWKSGGGAKKKVPSPKANNGEEKTVKLNQTQDQPAS